MGNFALANRLLISEINDKQDLWQPIIVIQVVSTNRKKVSTWLCPPLRARACVSSEQASESTFGILWDWFTRQPLLVFLTSSEYRYLWNLWIQPKLPQELYEFDKDNSRIESKNWGWCFHDARRSWATTSRRMVPPHPGPSSSCSQDARTQNRVLQSFSTVDTSAEMGNCKKAWGRWGKVVNFPTNESEWWVWTGTSRKNVWVGGFLSKMVALFDKQCIYVFRGFSIFWPPTLQTNGNTLHSLWWWVGTGNTVVLVVLPLVVALTILVLVRWPRSRGVWVDDTMGWGRGTMNAHAYDIYRIIELFYSIKFH